jgi:hypothetical protein
LPDTPCANAITSAMVAMPILILQYFIQVILIIGSQAKSAKFAVALIVYIFLLFSSIKAGVKFRKHVGKKSLQLSGQLQMAIRIESIGIDVELLQPG